VGIAVPHVVVIEEAPVNAVLAEDSFVKTHLPTQLLEKHLDYL